jgi:hypothetical protein
MIYVLAALLPPLGLLFNGQPFSAILNVVVIVVCVIFGLIFPILFLVPSAHALIAVHMKREDPAGTGRWSTRSGNTGRRRTIRAKRTVKPRAWQPSALIPETAMLSTTANPADGTRLDCDAEVSLTGRSIPRSYRGESAAEWSWRWRVQTDFRISRKPTRSTTCC